MEADTLGRIPIIKKSQGVEIMLTRPPTDPHHPILNNCHLLDLEFLNKYQQLDQPLLKCPWSCRSEKIT